MITTIPRLRSFVQRVLFVGPRAKGAESGANILINNIVGIIIGVIFLGVGIAVLLNTLDSSRTARAKDIMANEVASEVHAYYLDQGKFPAPGTAADVMTAMPGYFQSAPCDPVDATCSPSSTTASDFDVISGVTSTNASDYVLTDTAAHPGRTLNGLPKFAGNYTAPTATCSAAACTKLVYDGLFGVEGQ